MTYKRSFLAARNLFCGTLSGWLYHRRVVNKGRIRAAGSFVSRSYGSRTVVSSCEASVTMCSTERTANLHSLPFCLSGAPEAALTSTSRATLQCKPFKCNLNTACDITIQRINNPRVPSGRYKLPLCFEYSALISTFLPLFSPFSLIAQNNVMSNTDPILSKLCMCGPWNLHGPVLLSEVQTAQF